jgi:hypothetical protein
MGSKSAKPKKKDAKVLLEVYCMIIFNFFFLINDWKIKKEEIKFLIEHTTFTRDQIIDWHRRFLV